MLVRRTVLLFPELMAYTEAVGIVLLSPLVLVIGIEVGVDDCSCAFAILLLYVKLFGIADDIYNRSNADNIVAVI